MELEHAIEEMNEAFLGFNDKAIASGIADWEPNLARELKSTTLRFLEHARNMAQDTEVKEHQQTPNISARMFERESISPTAEPQPSSAIGQIAQSPSFSTQMDMVAIIAASLGYDPNYQSEDQETSVRNQCSEIDTVEVVQISNPAVSDWKSVEPPKPYRARTPDLIRNVRRVPSPQISPPMPSSYSFQETSFARRLLRTSLEVA